ncbi:polysaccharide biosynthesis/export family protein [Thiorhodovibrio frisius]|nr:polysaccharide biosynthesis/export family protein [Thiorhodovibrio frisius]
MAILLASPAAMAEDVADPEANTFESSGYGLHPGDIILISIWGEEGLDRPVLVGPDGRISFPLVGNLKAGGRTVEELTGIIAKRVSRYVPNPLVTVSLQDIPGNRIYVLGRVNKPGDFMIGRDVQVMQALAMAGGLTPFADRKDIKVLRTVDGKQVQIPFNYKEVERGKNLQQNIPLQAGDVVVVP